MTDIPDHLRKRAAEARAAVNAEPEPEPLPPPPPPVGFTYDGSPDALAKIEHLVGRGSMRMIEHVETRTQLNLRTGQRETAKLPKPDPATLEIRVHYFMSDGSPYGERWVYVPIGSWVEHARNSDVLLTVTLGPAVHPIEYGELRQ